MSLVDSNLGMSKGVIVYYIVGPVHLQNLDLIARQMPDWEFRAAYETQVRWFNSWQLDALKYDVVPLVDDKTPQALWDGDVRSVVFSSAQMRSIPVALLRAAFMRGIPTIAIEESNQVALNNGRINNYLLPVDRLLVASESERKGMLAAGVPEQRVVVVGWPFFTDVVGKTDVTQRKKMKKFLGLDADRPVAALTLTALGDAGETPEVRRRLLRLASQGMPDPYQLVVKPHPIEPLEMLIPFLQENAPDAKVVPGSVPIAQLLDSTDILLNRGVSQVCLEALLKEIPVIVLDTGIHTPFHGMVPGELIANNAFDLQKALALLAREPDVMGLYAAFEAEHLPYAPAQARELVCLHIDEVGSHAGDNLASDDQWFDLALSQAWLRKFDQALVCLSYCKQGKMENAATALGKIIERRAVYDDLLSIERSLEPGFRLAVLRSLWIDQC